MADYRLSVQVIKRSQGRSAVAAAAYRHAMRFEDERTAETHDYTRKDGVLHSEIMAPENAPDWMSDRAQLWNAVEAVERRKDAQLAREIQLSLPHELDAETRREIVQEFCQRNLVDHGMIADIALHAPSSQGDERNFHAHVMVTMRDLTGEGFGSKNRSWNDTDRLEEWREDWARIQNRALERCGSTERVDHRTLAAQGIIREPQKHLGPIACEIERDGRSSYRGIENRLIIQRNQLREEIRNAPDEDARRVAFEKLKFTNWEERKYREFEAESAVSRNQLHKKAQRDQARLEGELQRAHGSIKDVLDRKADTLESRLQAKGLRKFARDLFGRTKRDQQELQTVSGEKAKIAATEAQKRADLTKAEAARLAALKQAETAKLAKLEEALRKATQRREQRDWQPIKDQLPSAPKPAPHVLDASNLDRSKRFEGRADRRSQAEIRRDNAQRRPPVQKTPEKESRPSALSKFDQARSQSAKARDVAQEAKRTITPETKEWASKLAQDAREFSAEGKGAEKRRPAPHVNFRLNMPRNDRNLDPKAKKPTRKPQEQDRTPSMLADIFGIPDSIRGNVQASDTPKKESLMRRARREYDEEKAKQDNLKRRAKNWTKDRDREP